METIKIQSMFGNRLFEYEKENNTVKDTVLEAIRSGVNLRGVDLRGTNLRNAYLRNADLRGVDLRDAKNIPFIPMNLPEGEFIAWKKLPNDLIVKLKILKDSKRSRATGDKCRCDKALVVEFQNIDGTKSEETKHTSNQYAECLYEVGKVVEADKWDEDRFNECSYGSHFFIDRQSAVDY